MRDWIEEALQAPRDAWGLLLGLVSAFSFVALLKYQFSHEPMRFLMENWKHWSHAFWTYLASFINVRPEAVDAHILTATVLFWAVYFRGYFKDKTVDVPGSVVVALFPVALFLCAIFLMNLGDPINNAVRNNNFFAIIGGLALLSAFPLAIALGIAKTPRSFFGFVIAVLVLLIIDRIPLLPAAASAAGGS